MGENYFKHTPWKSIKNGGRPPAGPYFYASSDQFDRIRLRVGDVIWHNTLRPSEDNQLVELILCGRLVVDFITHDEAEARRIIWERIRQDYMWDGNTHAFAGIDAEPYDEVSIHDLASRICSQSKSGVNCLTIVDGMIEPYQLQTIRRLTAGTVRLLEERWHSHTK